MKYNRRFSLEEREQILAEYESGNFSQEELAFKYGIGKNVIAVWRFRLKNQKKIVSLPKVKTPATVEYQPTIENIPMAKHPKNPEEELQHLREQLIETRKALDWEKKRNLALETLIEVAEEHGMPVKKCGAKQ